MLQFIWTVIQDLFVTVTLVCLLHALVERTAGEKGKRIHRVGIGLGTIAAVGMGVAKSLTKVILTSMLRHYTYIFIIVFSLAFLVLSLFSGRKKDGTEKKSGTVLAILAACTSASWIFYSLTTVAGYPLGFDTMDQGYASWYFIGKVVGWVIAMILLAVYARLIYLCAKRSRKQELVLCCLDISLLINVLYYLSRYLAPWIQRTKWLKWPVRYTDAEFRWVKDFVLFCSRQAMTFIWVTMALMLLLGIVFFLGNTKVTEPYENSAQLRKLRAGKRGNRRLACGMSFFLLVCCLSLSVVKAYDTRVIELSAPETYTVSGEQILVPLEMVADEHLHRFEYTTENNVNVRWIVIKKPGSASYGVGLDACEVCGNAGYFERSGQVVCKRCDVVMNINTIGFKGGCNPIPLAYSVSEGNLVFELADILAGEKEFR